MSRWRSNQLSYAPSGSAEFTHRTCVIQIFNGFCRSPIPMKCDAQLEIFRTLIVSKNPKHPDAYDWLCSVPLVDIFHRSLKGKIGLWPWFSHQSTSGIASVMIWLRLIYSLLFRKAAKRQQREFVIVSDKELLGDRIHVFFPNMTGMLIKRKVWIWTASKE